MLYLIIIGLATFTAVMGVRALLPFALPARIMPLAVAGAAWGIEHVPARWHSAVVALAAGGVVAVVHRFAVTKDPEPWSLWTLLDRIPRPQARLSRPASRIGRRIPPL